MPAIKPTPGYFLVVNRATVAFSRTIEQGKENAAQYIRWGDTVCLEAWPKGIRLAYNHESATWVQVRPAPEV